MTTHIDGRTFKEVPADSSSPAVCPVTRRQRARVYSSATAHTAKAFLGEAAERLDIRAVQVDGGSEFMRHYSGARSFEDDCKERGLDLLVLPPRSPELNGIGRCLLKQGAPTARCASSAGASTRATSPAPR